MSDQTVLELKGAAAAATGVNVVCCPVPVFPSPEARAWIRGYAATVAKMAVERRPLPLALTGRDEANWQPVETAFLIEARRTGLAPRGIAEILGRSYASVRAQASRLGVVRGQVGAGAA